MYANPLISRVHNEFKCIRYELSSFFSNQDRDLIRFQFGETPKQFQFRVKFSSTHRSLKFTVDKENNRLIRVEKMEKTTDIVLDIDEINKVIGTEKPLDIHSLDFKSRLSELFLWGIYKNRERKQEIFRADALRLPNWNNETIANMSKEVLYFDIITSYEVITPRDSEGFIEVKLDLYWSEPYYITCQDYFLENIRPGRLLIVNWLQRFNVMKFSSAKHHLNFKAEDYQLIAMYLLSISNGNFNQQHEEMKHGQKRLKRQFFSGKTYKRSGTQYVHQ